MYTLCTPLTDSNNKNNVINKTIPNQQHIHGSLMDEIYQCSHLRSQKILVLQRHPNL